MTFVSGEYIVSADGALAAGIVTLAVALARTREKLARLEGRLEERDRCDDDASAV